MEVKKQVIVALGYGKYFLSDKIVGFVPIEDDRGPARRTYVYIDGLPEPVIASRTESRMLNDMTLEGPGEFKSAIALELVERVHTDLQHVGPMLRRSIREECGLDLDDIEKRMKELLSGDEQAVVQEGLFGGEDRG
ncbi:MAG: hypothetical protein KKB90_10610 [Actinobacteria bacterium]|nr:hypothetical protein [Actinomycetota bacterium]MCG2818508.1 hypothetical protein [Actinomycetes bacterium]MBU4179280.1 hypothetical protein [Actinomycetota bacterium]MBU4219396.1 hypothetical protein [Actinomycetota bacterium]MBU4358140.1 hypothetical protein [Actinomycetota bacterium]